MASPIRRFLTQFAGIATIALFLLATFHPAKAESPDLWQMYETTLKSAKYVDLTHAFSPTIPVWQGFGHAAFHPAAAGADIPDYINTGEEYTYAQHGFVATAYELPTDQYGTQLDPPAHWDEYGATISDLPPTYAIRPLVVINVSDRVATDPGDRATVADLEAWEAKHGKIPEGAVVMFRTDWYQKWNQGDRFNQKPFPSVSLEALQFLHLQRHILFHGHEPLDTDTTPNLEGEAWLLHNHYTQAEGVANLDKVPEAGALVAIGFAKPEGGTGGYARYIAICPPDWAYGAPLPKQPYPLRRDERGVLKPTPIDR